jgi:hypothetical protein
MKHNSTFDKWNKGTLPCFYQGGQVSKFQYHYVFQW